MKKGTEIIPEENYRLRNEDVFSSEVTKFGSKGLKKESSSDRDDSTASTSSS
jgi:hypothetical protein